MGTFIEVVINGKVCKGFQECGECLKVCPVDIFKTDSGKNIQVNGAEEDECILCNLCLEKCPSGAIKVIKLYENKER